MKKKAIFLLSLITFVNFSIEKPNLENYEKQKRLGGALADFNFLSEDFNIGYEKNSKFNIQNTVNIGPFYHTLRYNRKDNITNEIGLSKNLRDFVISKKLQSLNEFYKNKEQIFDEYAHILDVYSNLIVKKYEIQQKYDLINKMNSDKKILETQYKVGQISKIEYETMLVDLISFQNKVDTLSIEIKDLLDELKSFGYNESIDEIKDFEIKDIDYSKFLKYINSENEKEQIRKTLNEQIKKYELFPDINISAKYQIENKDFGIGLNFKKTFKLDGSDFTESKLGYNKNVKLKTLDTEKEKYKLLVNTYKILEKKANLISEQYKIDEVKYKVGKISYKNLTDSKIKENDAKIEFIKSKNNLALYILKKGL